MTVQHIYLGVTTLRPQNQTTGQTNSSAIAERPRDTSDG